MLLSLLGRVLRLQHNRIVYPRSCAIVSSVAKVRSVIATWIRSKTNVYSSDDDLLSFYPALLTYAATV